MRKRNKLVLVVTVCVLFVAGGIAQALISADFTPVNLVEQAELILMLRLSAPNAKGEVKAEIAKCLKGEKKAPKGPLTIDLTITAMKEHAKKFGEMLKTVKKDEPVLMFVGTNDKDEDISLIHMRGRWYSLDATDKPELWDFHQKSSEMEATWAGGTDMLLRITELLLKYPDMDVPVRSGVSWDEHSKAASLKGKITEALAPDLDGKGKLHLFLAGETGDHLFLYTDGLTEATNPVPSRSATTCSSATSRPTSSRTSPPTTRWQPRAFARPGPTSTPTGGWIWRPGTERRWASVCRARTANLRRQRRSRASRPASAWAWRCWTPAPPVAPACCSAARRARSCSSRRQTASSRPRRWRWAARTSQRWASRTAAWSATSTATG